MNGEIIFVDMDGVIVDFDVGVISTAGKPYEAFKTQAEKDWRNSVTYDKESWWANLPPMPDFHILWNYLIPFNPQILTAIPRADRLGRPGSEDISRKCAKGKWEWCEKHLHIPRDYFHCVLRENKKEYATHIVNNRVVSNVLIDDYPPNVKSFITNRGHGILHTSALTTINQLKILGFVNPSMRI